MESRPHARGERSQKPVRVSETVKIPDAHSGASWAQGERSVRACHTEADGGKRASESRGQTMRPGHSRRPSSPLPTSSMPTIRRSPSRRTGRHCWFSRDATRRRRKAGVLRRRILSKSTMRTKRRALSLSPTAGEASLIRWSRRAAPGASTSAGPSRVKGAAATSCYRVDAKAVMKGDVTNFILD